MFRSFFTGFDMFGATPSLRMRGESQATNLCAGVTSFILLLAFVYIFINSSIQIINFEDITAISVQNKQLREDTSFDLKTLYFAVGLRGIPVMQYPRFFNVQTFIADNLGNLRSITMIPCTLEMWDVLEDKAEYFFQIYQLGDKYCPIEEQDLKIHGLFNSKDYSFLYTQISACYSYPLGNGSNFDCASQAQITQFFNTWYSTSFTNYIIGSFLFINTAFNPQSEDPIVHYVEDHVWLTFTENLGTETLIQLGTYSIVTDESMLPWVLENTLSGVYVNKFYTNSFEVMGHNNNIYCQVYLMVGSHEEKIQREYGKIDDTLSYVGGLFGLVIAFMAFFMMSFNEYRYELFVGEIFNYQNSSKVKEDDFHFFKYVKYCAYDWMQTLGCCCEPDWEDCKKIHEIREEAQEQLDVQALLRRVSHLEQLVQFFITQEEDLCTYLTEGQHIDKIKKRRKVMHYYNKIIEGRAPLTIQTMNNIQNIFGIGTEMTGFQFTQNNFESQNHSMVRSGNFKKNIDEKLDTALKKGSNFLQAEEQLQLEEEDENMEQELTQAFYNLSTKSREKLQDKIPLKILKRLKKRHETQKKQQESAQNKLHKFLFFQERENK